MKKLNKIILLIVIFTCIINITTFGNIRKNVVKGYDGVNLYLSRDKALKNTKAVLVIAHGLASHSGMYDTFTKELNKNNITVYRYDHRGHGKSEGKRGYAKSIFEMVDDLQIIVNLAKKENPNIPVFVMGHSMGGQVTALYGTRNPNSVDGFILAAGVLRYNQMNFGYLPRPENPETYVSCFDAAHKTLNLPMDEGAGLSTPDPLMLQECSVSLINSLAEGVEYLKDNSRKFIDSVLLVSGDADLYVVPKDAIDFYNETKSKDKSLRLYNGIGHLLMVEKGGDIITNDIIEWINRRVKK